MLKKVNYKDNSKSKYTCDSCEKIIDVDQRIVIDRNKKKKYDLCKECWKKIRIIVERHKLKKGE